MLTFHRESTTKVSRRVPFKRLGSLHMLGKEAVLES